MNDEKFSALLDDELDASEVGQWIDQLCDSVELQNSWQQQHAARSAIQGVSLLQDDSFAKRVMAQVEQVKLEPVAAGAPAEESANSESWFGALLQPKWAGSFAVAASFLVAVVAFQTGQPVAETGGQQVVVEGTAGSPVLVATSQISTAKQAPVAGAQKASWSGQQASAKQLNGYLMDYNALHSAHRMKGALGYARVAAYTNSSSH